MGSGVSLVLLPPDLQSTLWVLCRSGRRCPEGAGVLRQHVCGANVREPAWLLATSIRSNETVFSNAHRGAMRAALPPDRPVERQHVAQATCGSIVCCTVWVMRISGIWFGAGFRCFPYGQTAVAEPPHPVSDVGGFACATQSHAFTGSDQANRRISTGQLSMSPCLHLRPIDVVVFHVPRARPCFEGGFPLRCLQRLSCPDIATLHCCWRNNRSTSGPSTPVLSY